MSSSVTENRGRKQLDAMLNFLGKVRILIQEAQDGLLTPEESLEEQEKIASQALEEINELALEFDQNTYEVFFKNLIYTSTRNQIKRYFGYHEAISAAEDLVRRYNQELGDNVLSLGSDSLTILHKIDSIYTAKLLIGALGLSDDEQQRIVNHMIDTNFKTVKS